MLSRRSAPPAALILFSFALGGLHTLCFAPNPYGGWFQLRVLGLHQHAHLRRYGDAARARRVVPVRPVSGALPCACGSALARMLAARNARADWVAKQSTIRQRLDAG